MAFDRSMVDGDESLLDWGEIEGKIETSMKNR